MVPLVFYIDFALEQLAVAQVQSISRAALRFKETALYREAQKFLGPLLGSFKSGYEEATGESVAGVG